MTLKENFSLKWNDFQANVCRSFSSLRGDNIFYDVTLVSDDQYQISAHKLVLSACSGYFKKILSQNNHSNPLLCLEGVSYADIQHVLDYIYLGEVQINQDQMDRFIYVAQRFQLDGLLLLNHEDSNTNYMRDNKKLDFLEVSAAAENKIEEESNRNYTTQSKQLDFLDVSTPQITNAIVGEQSSNKYSWQNKMLDFKEEITVPIHAFADEESVTKKLSLQENVAESKREKKERSNSRRMRRKRANPESPMFTVVNTSTETTREFTYYANLPNGHVQQKSSERI